MSEHSPLVIIGIGANLPTPGYVGPRATCGAALHALAQSPGLRILRCSDWYESAPVPFAEDQPWFVNAAVAIDCTYTPRELMARLLQIEADFGRRRGEKNAPRTLDLDILAFGNRIEDGDPVVPHPRLSDRAFALLPIRDLASDWLDPRSGRSIERLIAALPAGQDIRVMPAADGYMATEWSPGPVGGEGEGVLAPDR